jgi:hypothetical protein
MGANLPQQVVKNPHQYYFDYSALTMTLTWTENKSQAGKDQWLT